MKGDLLFKTRDVGIGLIVASDSATPPAA